MSHNTPLMESISCPYLGLKDDPYTSTAFAYIGNLCYRSKPAAPVVFFHQENYCLKPAHTDCPGYKDGWKHGLPRELRGGIPTWKKIVNSKWARLGLFLVVLVSLGLVFSEQISAVNQNLLTRVDNWLPPTPLPEVILLPSNTATSTHTLTPTETNTPTLTFTPTSTPTRTSTRTATYTMTATRFFLPPPTDTAVPFEPPPQPTQPPPTQPPPQPTKPPPQPTQPPPTQPPPPTDPPPPTQPPPTETPDIRPTPTEERP